MSLLRFFRRNRHDTDLAREIAAHMEAERAENLARGLSPDEAARLALVKFGSERRSSPHLDFSMAIRDIRSGTNVEVLSCSRIRGDDFYHFDRTARSSARGSGRSSYPYPFHPLLSEHLSR
jgi:hypothetical protein